jgi:hypothetical protein
LKFTIKKTTYILNFYSVHRNNGASDPVRRA